MLKDNKGEKNAKLSTKKVSISSLNASAGNKKRSISSISQRKAPSGKRLKTGTGSKGYITKEMIDKEEEKNPSGRRGRSNKTSLTIVERVSGAADFGMLSQDAPDIE